jgi:hypothetical protein
MDLHDEFDRYGHAHGDAVGSRLREGGVRAALEARVSRGRRVQKAKWGAGVAAVAAVGGVGAWALVGHGPAGEASPAVGDYVPAINHDLPTVPVLNGDFFGMFGLHGPEDGIVDEPSKISQTIPDQFACGAQWTLEPGYYLNQTRERFVEFGDGVTSAGTALDVKRPQITFVSRISTDLGSYYDTFVLAWVKDGVIVGNARVSRAYGPLLEGTSGERLSTVRGASAEGVDMVTLPLVGPGACEAGAVPAGLADGPYELHVIHEYSGNANVRVDGHQYDDPSVQIARPTDGQLVEFISGDPFGAVVDSTGGPWTIEVVGLGGSEN